MIKPVTITLALLTLLLGPALSMACETSLHARDGWIRAAPPGASMLAGYLMLHNPSEKDRTLVSADSPDFGMVEVHRSVVENGIAKMFAQETLVIPATEHLMFEPGGYHLMLMQPKRALNEGDKTQINLHFADGGILHVPMQVRKTAGKAHSHEQHEHHEHGSE